MRSQSLLCQSLLHLRQKLESITQNGFFPTLAIVFSSSKHDLNELVRIFDEKGIDLVGCSTAGEIVDDSLAEESIAVLLLDMNREFYHIKTTSFELYEVYEKSLEVGVFTKQLFESPGMLLMSGGINLDALKLIAGIKDGVGKEIPLYGGMAADDLHMTQTFAFSNHFVSDCGVAALIIDVDKILIKGLATSGWKPLGGVNTITGADGNIVYSINDEPALDVFMRHFGFDKPDSKKDQLILIQTNYPLQLIKNDFDSVLRSPLVIDESNKSLVLAAGVETGDKFRFSNSPGFEVIEQTIEEFNFLKQQAPEADAMVLFSCIGRYGAFGPVLEEEIQGLHNYWQKPMVGFLSYGEFGNTRNGICEFHNETCSLVILKEK